MRLSDGAVVPGNRHVDAGERARRLSLYYEPYHSAIAKTIDRSLSVGAVPALVSIHSFTPSWRGWWRPWQVGVLWDLDARLARPMIARLAEDRGLVVGDNEPYVGALRNDTLFRHATRRGLAHALLELRQDLIVEEAGVRRWVERLAVILDSLNRMPGIHEISHFGSRTGPVPPFAAD
jgi:predicted N-formylglutamate amidohydrolase